MEVQESIGQGTGDEVVDFIAVEPTRPTCPRCGSRSIISRGDTWHCTDCRRRWIKHADYCPHCGQALRGVNNGQNT